MKIDIHMAFLMILICDRSTGLETVVIGKSTIEKINAFVKDLGQDGNKIKNT